MKAQKMKKDVKVAETDGKRVVRARVAPVVEEEQTTKKKSGDNGGKSVSKTPIPVASPSAKKKSAGAPVVTRKPRVAKEEAPVEKKKSKEKEPTPEELRKLRQKEAGRKAAETRRRNQLLRDGKDAEARSDKVAEAPREKRSKGAEVAERRSKAAEPSPAGTHLGMDFEYENVAHIWADVDHALGHLLDSEKRLKASSLIKRKKLEQLQADMKETLKHLSLLSISVRNVFTKVFEISPQ